MFKDFKPEIKKEIKKSRKMRDSLTRRPVESNHIPRLRVPARYQLVSRAGGIQPPIPPQSHYTYSVKNTKPLCRGIVVPLSVYGALTDTYA